MKYLIGIFVLLAGLNAGVAQTLKAPYTVTMMAGWQNRCRADCWAPVEIMVTSQTDEPFIGNLEFTVTQDSQHRLVIYRPMVVMPTQTLRVTLSAKFSYASDHCQIRLINRDGRVCYNQSYDLFDYRARRGMLSFIESDQTFIATAGRSGVSLPRKKINEKRERLVTCQMPPQMLPQSWVGYTSLDALVLNDPDFSQFNPAQQEAMAEWIGNGGRVMIVLGSKSIPSDSPIAKLIPVKIESPVETELPTELLDKWQVKAETSVKAAVWRIEKSSIPEGWSVLAEDADGGVLEVAGDVGFGQIVLLMFDPSGLPWSTETASEAFWMDQLPNLADAELVKDAKEDEESYMRGDDNFTFEDAGANNILGYLMSIAQLEPISFGWVFGTLMVMAILIGPVDYLVLKKLNKLPMTYVTYLSILTVFTVGAYFGVQYLRAGSDQLRRVCVLDKIDGTNHCWQTGYTGIFASKSGDYPLTGFSGQSWWSGAAPAQEYWRGGGGQGIKSNIVCVQQEGNTPASLPVNIWSMRTLMDESPGKEFPLTAEVTVEDGKLTAKLTNLGQASIDSGMIVFEEKYVRFKIIEPGQTVTVNGEDVSLKSTRQEWIKKAEADPMQYMYRSDDGPLYPWLTLEAKGIAPRTKGIERRLGHGGAVIYAEINDRECPIGVKDKKVETNQTVYLRLVVPHVQRGS